MPQDIVETFARSLIDEIVLEASDETVTRPTKELSQIYTPPNNMYMGYNKRDEQEVLERMVNDLRDVQIGDSHYVYSPPMSRFDRQGRRPACFVDNSSVDVDTADVVEISGIQGQGDVESVVHDTEPMAVAAVAMVVTSPTDNKSTESTTTTTNAYRKEREQMVANDATKVTINVLHRMIEELETVTEDVNDANEKDKIAERTKEEIAIWEEKEERLIRIIEGNEGSCVSVSEESPSTRQFMDEEREELKSSMLMSGASSSRNLSIDDEGTSDCQAMPASTRANDDDDDEDVEASVGGDMGEVEKSPPVAEETKATEKDSSKQEDKKKAMKKKKKKGTEEGGGKKESLGRRLKRFFLRSVRREKN